MRLLAIVGVVAACDAVPENVPLSDAGDVDDAAADDLDPDSDGPTRCDPSSAFGTPRPVAGVNTTNNEYGIRLLSSGLDGILTRDFQPASGGQRVSKVHFASRSATDVAFASVPLVLGPVYDGGNAGVAQLMDDQLTLYFESNRTSNQYDLFVATRPNTGVNFETPDSLPLAPINTASSEGQMFLTRTGDSMWFGRSMVVYESVKSGTTFQPPVQHDELGVASNPVLTEDGLEIFVSSTNNDIYHATRTATTQPFGLLSKIDEVSSVAIDLPSDISPDGCDLYFASDRGGAGTSGGYDVFVANRPRPPGV